MSIRDSAASDMIMMRRCVTLAQSAGQSGEYPFAAVIARRGEFICESLNMVKVERDVTRHAEMVAISLAQKKLSTSLDDCTLFSTIEPCAMCSYAIRESRISRVVFSLRSPVMGGYSRWNILTDGGLFSTLPEVFAQSPDVRSGPLHYEVQKAFHTTHGIPPCRYLRMLRLSQARRALLSADGNLVTVTEIATGFGFVELGRFSVEYRKVFGESPSQTLHRVPSRKILLVNSTVQNSLTFGI